MVTEKIGKVVLNYAYYSGQDLYSDGEQIENQLLEIVKKEGGYEYVHESYSNWACLYHLSRQRENIVEPMQLSKADKVLEIGAGMGAITWGRLSVQGSLPSRRRLPHAHQHSPGLLSRLHPRHRPPHRFLCQVVCVSVLSD